MILNEWEGIDIGRSWLGIQTARDWIPGLPLGFSQRVPCVKEWRSILPFDKLFASGYESNAIFMCCQDFWNKTKSNSL